MDMLGTLVVLLVIALVATLVIEVIVVGTGARVADLPAPLGRVIAAVLTADALAFLAAGIALVPGCFTSALLGGWASWVISALLMWFGRALGYRILLGGRLGTHLQISGVVTGVGVVLGGLMVLIGRTIAGI